MFDLYSQFPSANLMMATNATDVKIIEIEHQKVQFLKMDVEAENAQIVIGGRTKLKTKCEQQREGECDEDFTRVEKFNELVHNPDFENQLREAKENSDVKSSKKLDRELSFIMKLTGKKVKKQIAVKMEENKAAKSPPTKKRKLNSQAKTDFLNLCSDEDEYDEDIFAYRKRLAMKSN